MGYIYILTNPSFEDYVKIGYADDYVKRLKELNRSECMPFAFRVYAVYEVDHRLTDMKLHSIIDKLNPDLRSIDNVDGKKRVREFYKMSKEDAYSLFEAIAEINGTVDRIKLIQPTIKEIAEEKTAEIDSIGKNYTEEYHLNKADTDIQKVYTELKKMLCSKGLFIEPQKLYIAFKNDGGNVVDVCLTKRKIKIYFNVEKGKLKDPEEYTRDVSNIGHWGNGDYEALISTIEEVEYIKKLVEQIIS